LFLTLVASVGVESELRFECFAQVGRILLPWFPSTETKGVPLTNVMDFFASAFNAVAYAEQMGIPSSGADWLAFLRWFLQLLQTSSDPKAKIPQRMASAIAEIAYAVFNGISWGETLLFWPIASSWACAGQSRELAEGIQQPLRGYFADILKIPTSAMAKNRPFFPHVLTSPLLGESVRFYHRESARPATFVSATAFMHRRAAIRPLDHETLASLVVPIIRCSISLFQTRRKKDVSIRRVLEPVRRLLQANSEDEFAVKSLVGALSQHADPFTWIPNIFAAKQVEPLTRSTLGFLLASVMKGKSSLHATEPEVLVCVKVPKPSCWVPRRSCSRSATEQMTSTISTVWPLLGLKRAVPRLLPVSWHLLGARLPSLLVVMQYTSCSSLRCRPFCPSLLRSC
jgi:hypothetical protein